MQERFSAKPASLFFLALEKLLCQPWLQQKTNGDGIFVTCILSGFLRPRLLFNPHSDNRPCVRSLPQPFALIQLTPSFYLHSVGHFPRNKIPSASGSIDLASLQNRRRKHHSFLKWYSHKHVLFRNSRGREVVTMGTEADTQIGATHFSQGSTSRDSSLLLSPSEPLLKAFFPELENRPKCGKRVSSSELPDDSWWVWLRHKFFLWSLVGTSWVWVWREGKRKQWLLLQSSREFSWLLVQSWATSSQKIERIFYNTHAGLDLSHI